MSQGIQINVRKFEIDEKIERKHRSHNEKKKKKTAIDDTYVTGYLSILGFSRVS